MYITYSIQYVTSKIAETIEKCVFFYVTAMCSKGQDLCMQLNAGEASYAQYALFADSLNLYKVTTLNSRNRIQHCSVLSYEYFGHSQSTPLAAMDVEVTTLPIGLEECLPDYKEALSDGFYIRQKTSKNDDWNEEECLLLNLNLYVCWFANMLDEYFECK